MKKISILTAITIFSLFFLSSCSNDDDNTTQDPSAQNVQLVESFYQLADNGDTAAYSQIFSDNFVDENRSPNTPANVTDKDNILNTLGQLNSGFTNGTHNISIIRAIDENRVVVYWTFTGKHTDTFFGTPASNNDVRLTGIDIFQIENGQFVAQWHVEDLLGLFAQIQ